VLSLLLALTNDDSAADRASVIGAVRPLEAREGYDIVRDGRVLGRVVERDSDAGEEWVEVHVRAPGRLFSDRVRIRKGDVVSVDVWRHRLTLRSAGRSSP
jgi:hypothetical protein